MQIDFGCDVLTAFPSILVAISKGFALFPRDPHWEAADLDQSRTAKSLLEPLRSGVPVRTFQRRPRRQNPSDNLDRRVAAGVLRGRRVSHERRQFRERR